MMKTAEILGTNRFETFSKTRAGSRAVVIRDGLILLPPIEGVPEDLSRYEQLIDAFAGAAA